MDGPFPAERLRPGWSHLPVSVPVFPPATSRRMMRTMSAHAHGLGGARLPDAGPLHWRVVAAAAAPVCGLLLFTGGLWLELRASDPVIAGGAPFYLVAFGVLAVVAYLTSRRRPENPVGWMLGVSALCLGAATFGTAAAEQPYLGWLSGMGMLATCLSLTFLFLLFPTGHLPSRRWRPVAWFAGVTLVVTMTGVWFAPGPLFDGNVDENPLGAPVGGEVLQLAVQISPLLIGAAAVASIAALVLRWQRAEGEERQQSAWLLLGGVVLLACLPVVLFAERLGVPREGANALAGTLLVAVLPGAVGFALLRSRLMGIDLLLRRTVVVVLAWLLIGSGFAALVTLSGVPPVPALLLAVAVVMPMLIVDPVRRTVDGWVDRGLVGGTARPYDLVAGMAGALPAGSSLLDVGHLLAESVVSGVGLRWCRVVLPEGTVAAGEMDGQTLVVLPLRAEGEGSRLECGPKDFGQLTTSDLDLLGTLSSQAALALATTRLAARLVRAQDAERRRIERDLHDGAQQRLVALALGLAMARAEPDLSSVRQRLRELEHEAGAALREVRDLAHGIHPSVLTDVGLVAALRTRCDAFSVPVRLHVAGRVADLSLPSEVAATAYFVVLEAMTNAVKHADPAALVVRLDVSDGRLRVEVEDDGRGVDPAVAGVPRPSTIADRVTGLGGRLEVSRGAAGGTLVSAELPTQEVSTARG
jgi:signal transduction histidine kinase